jgi:prepilin-type N-terminal cleavage/methylation domain-containing protein
MEGSARQRATGGFSLVEVLVGLAVLSAVAVAVASISVAGVLRVSDDNQDRQGEATTAQWASIAFARDVQGAAGVAPVPCGDAGSALVTFRASDSDRTVTYWSAPPAGPGPYALVRTECEPGGTPSTSRTVVEDLQSPPAIQCIDGSNPVACASAARLTRAVLSIGQSNSFSFALDGSRRMTGESGTFPPPQQVPTFLAIGGATPLAIRGNACLQVVGNAYVNKPPNGAVAVDFDGNSRLEVTQPTDREPCLTNPPEFQPGEFRLQEGATCPGCPGKANPVPQSPPFPDAAPDPLRFLPVPPADGAPIRTDCPVTGGVRVCEPGVYEVEFPPSQGGGGVKDFEFRPGTYILRAGIKVNNGSVAGDRVLLVNQAGSVSINGADLSLSPPTEGIYTGILLFQPRGNTSPVDITGNARLASLEGSIYAPPATPESPLPKVTLGGGGGVMRVGRVIGGNLEVSGTGTVIVNGS